MSDLAAFLLERIAEDESDARGLGNAWARWVLAECEAKRRIVGAYRDEAARRDIYQSDDARAVEDEVQMTRRRSSAALCRGLEIAVAHLTLPYVDHPSFQEEWRP